MLHDQQLTETAIRLVAAELRHLATADHSERIGELLCEHHCPDPECSHDPAESAAERNTVQAKVRGNFETLLVELARYARARNVTIPEE